MQEPFSTNNSEKPDYRKEDISTGRLILYIGGGFAVFTLLLMLLIFAFSGKPEKPVSGTAGIAEQMTALKKSEDSILTTYALTDSANRIYRVPVDSAMKLLLNEPGIQSKDPTGKNP